MDRELRELTQRLEHRTPGLMDATGRYAVLVPLVELEGELGLLYEVRAATMRRQPGEVCFPGGRMEPGESARVCALRETWEELGIPEREISVIGELDFIAHRANFIMYPVLAQISAEAVRAMRLNRAEVAEVFFASLRELREHPPLEYSYMLEPSPPENFPYERIGIPRNYNWQRGGEEVLVYDCAGHVIWGLTGRITRHLLTLLSGDGM